MLTKLKSLPVVNGRIRIRDNNGPTEQLGELQSFVELEGQLYPLSFLRSAPGALAYQVATVDIEEDDRNPYLVREEARRELEVRCQLCDALLSVFNGQIVRSDGVAVCETCFNNGITNEH